MEVKFFATYRYITNCKAIDIPAPPDVWTLLNELGGRYGAPIREMLFTPDGSEIGVDAIILVNGRNIQHLEGKKTPLSESDDVCVFPMVAGG